MTGKKASYILHDVFLHSNLRNQITGTTISTPVANETTGEVMYESETPTYLYNAGDQRIKKYEVDDDGYTEDDTTKYFYTGSAVLYTTNNANELMMENILDPNGQIIASKRFDDDGDSGTPYELANQYFFYHYDIRGSVTNIVRPDGKLIERNTYDEFGNKVTTEYDENGNPITNPNNELFENEVTFTSSITDTSTGLQFMNARYYDATTGRFLSQDTYSGNAYEPWTQHLYSYCGNNPVNMIDPTGHSAYIALEEMKKAKKRLQEAGKETKHLDNNMKFVEREIEKSRPKAKGNDNNHRPSAEELKEEMNKEIGKVTNALKEQMSKNSDGTISIGGVLAGGFGLYGSISGQVSIDLKGNIAIQGSAGGGGGSPSASASVFISSSNAPNVNKLEGETYQIGGSAGEGISVGGEYGFFSDNKTGEAYHSGTIMVGAGINGILAEGHGEVVHTETVAQWNIVDIVMDSWAMQLSINHSINNYVDRLS